MKFKSILIIIVVVLIVVTLSFLYFSHSPSQQKNYGFEPLSIGQSTVNVEIANTEAKRTLGLGNRSTLLENNGMLFVFDKPGTYGFWMKDTNFPLDFIWIDENKKIIDITNDVLPETYPKVFYSSSPVLYVLEVGGGWAESHGIKIGAEVGF